MKTLVVIPFDAAQREKLEAAFPSMKFVYAYDTSVQGTGNQPFDRDAHKEDIETADYIIGNIPPACLKDAKNLKLLQLNSAGTNAYLPEGVMPEGAMLCNATGAYGKAVGEHMFGLLYALVKRLHTYRDNMKEGVWTDLGKVKSLSEMTVLSIGMGDIGCEFMRLCKALGAHTIGIRRSGTSKPDYVDELFHMEQLDECLSRADAVGMSLPATPATHHIINAERMASFKDGAYLLNAGRGDAVVNDVIVDALRSGKLAGFGADVTDPEPLPADHELWKEKNALITPHISGGYHLYATISTIADIAIENIDRNMKGEELLTPVDKKTGYRITK